MRGLDVIDQELRLVAAIRTTSWGWLGARPTVDKADQLLDERLLLMRQRLVKRR